jgi:rfaE bifunctional protein kinase chain/domain
LANRRVLIVGDVFLDEYLTGTATRMSREAPVPVLEFDSRRVIPGGAANPAANIAALGSTAVQTSVVGADDFAEQLRGILAERDIQTHGLIADPARPTTVKTRVMAQMGLRFPQQVARLDRLSREPIAGEIQATLLDVIREALPTVDAVLCSDYRVGLMTPALVDAIRAESDKVILTADAQGELGKYSGFTLVKCNADEARTYLGRDIRNDADFADAARALFHSLNLSGAMVITRGASGATVATVDQIAHCPAPVVADVFDTVGAGDTAIAVQTLAIIAGATFEQAVTLANYASGLVVRRVGNYTPSPDELTRAIAMWD